MTNPLQAEEIVYAGRQVAERIMGDACTIQRPATGVFNESTGTYADASTTLYTGKCRVHFQNIADNTVNAGGRAASIREYVVSVPVSSTVFLPDDLVTITASGLDPSQVGLTLRVEGVLHGSQITARRLRCQEVTS